MILYGLAIDIIKFIATNENMWKKSNLKIKNVKIPLTRTWLCAILYHNQTVDAEITSDMPSQRARDAESRVRNKSANGPQRVRRKSKS
jgi:hypothetical protein